LKYERDLSLNVVMARYFLASVNKSAAVFSGRFPRGKTVVGRRNLILWFEEMLSLPYVPRPGRLLAGLTSILEAACPPAKSASLCSSRVKPSSSANRGERLDVPTSPRDPFEEGTNRCLGLCCDPSERPSSVGTRARVSNLRSGSLSSSRIWWCVNALEAALDRPSRHDLASFSLCTRSKIALAPTNHRSLDTGHLRYAYRNGSITHRKTAARKAFASSRSDSYGPPKRLNVCAACRPCRAFPAEARPRPLATRRH
jgi:hypothetical protein